MSGIFALKTNTAKENNGIPVTLDDQPNEDGTVPTFILSRMGKGNKAYSKALETATRPFRRQMELGTMKNDVAEKLFRQVFADSIVKGWENVQDEQGVVIPFSSANVLSLIEKEGMDDLYQLLQQEASLAANFRDNALEAEAKN